MAVTRLKRKNRKNKTASRLKKAALKKVTKVVNVKSPNKERTGIVEAEA